MSSEDVSLQQSYKQIARATTILGGSSIINIALRILKTKVLAILVGPSGIGLLGIYTLLMDVVGVVATLGVDSSGVKQVAEASGKGNTEQIARTIHAVRWLALLSGVSGMIIVILLSPLISQWMFHNDEHVADVVMLSLVVVIGTLMSGEIVLIQGLRRLGDLAKANILGAALGAFLSILICFVWGIGGVGPSLVAASAAGLLGTWMYSRKVALSQVRMTWSEIKKESVPLLRLGLGIMSSSLIVRATMFLVGVIVVRELDLHAAGLYQAAVTISSVYVGFVLDSMVKDYLPRLSASANNHVACNQLVNEQVEMGMLLAAPGILVTITFAPVILHAFYTSDFVDAFGVLRWQILGVFLQVVSWPLLFVLQAKGRGSLMATVVAVTDLLYISLVYLGIAQFGLVGTGMAFFARWCFFGVVLFYVCKSLTGFSYSVAVKKVTLYSVPAIVAVFSAHFVLDEFWFMLLGGSVSLVVGLYSVKAMINAVGAGYLLGKYPLLARLGLLK
jgi:antigen flippase